MVEVRQGEVQHWPAVRDASRPPLAPLSLTVHPGRLVDSTRPTSPGGNASEHVKLQALETWLATHGLPVQQGPLAKVRTPLAGVSALIDFWWQTVWHDMEHMAMPPRWTPWREEWLLPLRSWQEQRARTRCPEQQAQIARALQAVQDALERHPCTRRLTPAGLAGWHAWADEPARAFQRAASAVAGRHGSLAPMPHNPRGWPLRR